MKFKIIGSDRLVTCDIRSCRVDWAAKVKRGGKKNFGKFQYDAKQLLKPHWKNHIVLEEFKIPALSGEKNRSLDLVNLTTKQVVECDGIAHLEYHDFFHDNKFQFLRQLRNDNFKDQWAELNGFEVFRIYETDDLSDELLMNLNIIS